MTWLRRAIIRLHIRRRTAQPQVYRFHADRWHNFRVLVAAGQMQMQQLDSVALTYSNQPTLLVVRTHIEGAAPESLAVSARTGCVTFWKVDSAAPAVNSTPKTPVRTLRPVEVTTDVQWSQASKPAIVISNQTAQEAKVEIFYAVREEDGGGGFVDF